MSFNIEVESGKSVRLTTKGKYCDRDIVVTATGGGTTPADPIIEPLSVTENGTYTAPSGVDGYSPVTVNVPIPDGYIVPNGTKNITENGTHGVTEYASVNVNVPIPEGYIQPSGTLDITENGIYDVAEKASAVVSIPEKEIVLQDKTIDANGIYSADEGYDGLGKITVIVPSSGGGGGAVEDLSIVLIEQEALIAELQETLSHKMADRDSDLPDGYYRVDFIEFNGKQLVDTGLIGNQDTRIRTSFTWGSSTQNHVFGCASPDNTASITSYMNGSWRFGSNSVTKSITKNSNTLPYSVYVDKTTIGVTGSVTAISDVNDFETINTLLLGGARNSSGELPGTGLIGRIFYFYVWDGDTPVMKLIPVSNGTKYRFWDEVSKVFFDSIDDTPLEGGNL